MNLAEQMLLKKAIEYKKRITLYQNKYKNIFLQNFQEIPLLRKSELIEDQKKNQPFGSFLNIGIDQVVRIHRTSGTTDKPLILALTQNDEECVVKTGRKAFKGTGVTNGDIIVNCMNYCMWMGGFMDHRSLEATGAAVIPYGVGHTENLIDLIRMMPNICIHSTPSYLSRIEKVAKEKYGINPDELGIKKGLFGGEGGLSDKEYREQLEKKWGMEIYDANYGMSEVMSIIAAEDQKKNGLKFAAQDILYPELYIKERNSVSNSNICGGEVGELVLSNCCKEAQPLIRYATGDIIKIIEAEDEEIKKDFKFIVLGRSDDMIVVKGINFYPNVLKNIIYKYTECTGNYQVKILNKNIVDYVRLIIELKNQLDPAHSEYLRKAISEEINLMYFVKCDVRFSTCLISGNNKLRMIERVKEFE